MFSKVFNRIVGAVMDILFLIEFSRILRISDILLLEEFERILGIPRILFLQEFEGILGNITIFLM